MRLLKGMIFLLAFAAVNGEESILSRREPGEITPVSATQGGTLKGDEVKFAAAHAIDRDLSTSAATETDHGKGWLKIALGQTYMIRQVVIYWIFENNWYDSNQWCARNVANFNYCVEQHDNVGVAVYKGDVFQGACETLHLTAGLERTDQIYTLTCNAEGDIVKLSKDTGHIVIYEVVIRELEQVTDGGWGHWSEWGSCSKTCGGGTQTRTRTCNNPALANEGHTCGSGTTQSNFKSCNSQHCPGPVTDGGWGHWSGWSSCSKTCGGIQERSRTCNNPAPANGGSNCGSGTTQIKFCNNQDCPGTNMVDVVRDVLIPWDPVSENITIRTNSEKRSYEKVHVGFYDDNNLYAGYVAIWFTRSPIRYLLGMCSYSYIPFPDSLPAETEKVWMISYDQAARRLTIHCNEVEMVNLVLSDSVCKYSSWRDIWGRKPTQIKFVSWDTASVQYLLS